MLAQQYLLEVEKVMRHIRETQLSAVLQVAPKIVEHMGDTGTLFVFGASHSSMIAQEVYYRAGGLATVKALFAPGLMLDQQPVTMTSELERLEGLGRIVVRSHGLGARDVLVVVSTSGRNAVPIDAALEAKERGAMVVALTSLPYSRSVPSRHSSSKRLFEVADVVLDTGTPAGDAAVDVPGTGKKMGPLSTVAGVLLINLLILQVVEELVARGRNPAILVSGNLDGGHEANLATYRRLDSSAFSHGDGPGRVAR